MVNRTLARRYAIAAISLARERGVADRVGDGLTAIAKTIGTDGLVYDFFVAPVIDRDEKQRVLAAAFENKVDDVALHTLLLLVRKRRETLLPAIVDEYLALERAAHNTETLILTVARHLERDEYRRLIERLERVYGKSFQVTERIDPTVIGGLRVQMGDRRIDATVSGRLNALARELSVQ